jgi:hypothetical protein
MNKTRLAQGRRFGRDSFPARSTNAISGVKARRFGATSVRY